MHTQRGLRAAGIAAAGVTIAMALASCSGPGGSDPAPTVEPGENITAPITAEQVAELGDIELDVWADQGEQQLMELYIPAYEQMYPNVTVNVQYKSFNDLTSTVVNAMNSDTPPDVAQGNQGWATDGALVKAGLVRPLDDLATAYEYQDAAGDAISQLMWSSDGKTFGSGSVYGMSPDNQMVGIFYNKEKLAELGLAVPTTLAELESALAAAKAAGQVPLELGNADKAGAMQALSVIQGALTPASDTRGWITGADGADFTVASNVEALDTFTDWVEAGYVSEGFNGTSPDDAAAGFAAGDGVFFIGGNWYAGEISDGEKFGFVAGVEDGEFATNGSFGLNWHVSAKSDAEIAALAFVGLLNSAETAALLAEVNRVPIHEVEVGSDPMFTDLLTASTAQLEGAGPLYWYDWATDTMFDTFAGGLQTVLAGQISSEDFLSTVQEDWNAFHAE